MNIQINLNHIKLALGNRLQDTFLFFWQTEVILSTCFPTAMNDFMLLAISYK
jgi:hypothetical protein